MEKGITWISDADERVENRQADIEFEIAQLREQLDLLGEQYEKGEIDCERFTEDQYALERQIIELKKDLVC